MQNKLYPHNSEKLTAELFKNPTSEYRATPFWSWNCKLDKTELLRQIDILEEMGFGGFHMHVRTGLDTTYLGDEYMQLVKDCVDKARSKKMLAWLYDEDRWPSGSAGGYVTKNVEHRSCHLLLTRIPYGEIDVQEAVFESKANNTRTGNGNLIACFDVSLDEFGFLDKYKKINENDKADGFKLYAYVETAIASPWFNNQAYVNTLDPKAIASFINITHEKYYEWFSEQFGNIIPAIFTDEPQFTHKKTLGFADELKDVVLPWSYDIDETYRKIYDKDNIILTIPELLWDFDDNPSISRYRYHEHISELFSTSFAKQCANWCEKHGIMLTGHMMSEDSLFSQTEALGEVMRSLSWFQLPGIDMLLQRL